MVVAAAAAAAVAVMALAMMAKEAVAAVAVKVVIFIHDNISRALLGRAEPNGSGQLSPLAGGVGAGAETIGHGQ